MTQGFPLPVAELSKQAVRYVNIHDVTQSHGSRFTYDESANGGFIYHAADGSTTKIPDFPKNVSIEGAFNEVLAASWGAALNCPIAPVVFQSEGNQPIILSIKAFANTVTQEIVLEKAQRQDALKATKRATELSQWVTLVDGAKQNRPLHDMEQLLFTKTIPHLSRLTPFVNWIGGWDPDTSNIVVDRDALLEQLKGQTGNKPLGIYLCDFTDSMLGSGFNDGVNPTPDTPLNKSPLSGLAEFIRAFPSVFKQESRLARRNEEEEFDPSPMMNPIFAPHLDFAAMKETIGVILSYDNQLIKDEMRRLAIGMAQFMENNADVAKLFAYAEYKADVLILRRDQLKEHMAPLLAFEGKEKPEGNPFVLFEQAVDAHIRDDKAAKRAAKQATRPKRKAKKDKGGQKPET